MKYILFFLLVFLSPLAFSQTGKADTFFVENASKKLKPSERKYIQYTETKDGFILFNSILTRKLERTAIAGTEGWLSVQSYQLDKYIDKDSSFSAVHDLLPVFYHTDVQSEAHKEIVEFRADGINHTILYKDSSKKFRKENTWRYNGVMTDDIISTMPLKKDAVFVIKAVNPGERYFEYLTVVAVEAQEEIEIDGIGKLLCWRVRTGKGGKTGSLEWYTVKGQVQVKKKFEFANGSVFYRVLLAG